MGGCPPGWTKRSLISQGWPSQDHILEPRPLGLTPEQRPDPREAVGYRTQQAKAGHGGAFLGKKGRSSTYGERAPVYARSIFKRLAPVVRDAVALDLDRRAARPDGLSHHRCKPGEHKSCQHVTPESMGEHGRFGRAVLPGVGEYFEGAPLLVCHAAAQS